MAPYSGFILHGKVVPESSHQQKMDVDQKQHLGVPAPPSTEGR